jgi:hypothetical protein
MGSLPQQPQANPVEEMNKIVEVLQGYVNEDEHFAKLQKLQTAISQMQEVVAILQAQAQEGQAGQTGQAGGKKKRKARRGGADFNMSTQGSMLYNTTHLEDKNFAYDAVSSDPRVAALQFAPSPFTSGATSMYSPISDVLPSSLFTQVAPSISG